MASGYCGSAGQRQDVGEHESQHPGRVEGSQAQGRSLLVAGVHDHRLHHGGVLGEYGLSDICFGVPCKLGANGVEEIIQFDLTDAALLKAWEQKKWSV